LSGGEKCPLSLGANLAIWSHAQVVFKWQWCDWASIQPAGNHYTTGQRAWPSIAYYLCYLELKYCIAQNSGGVKLWQISDFKALVRKILVNAQHLYYLYYWQEKKFGKSEGKLSFINLL